ncbi:MAG: monovalent cation:proton antiporter-2 (CPA2) family protein [Pseudomonadota bacterium]
MAVQDTVDPLLVNAALFLGAAVVAVPIFKRIGLGSVLGYLAAGAVIGPFGLGFVAEAESVRHVAEFGVVLLLFVIGLELRPQRLWRLRLEIFGLGLAQVAATSALLATTLWLTSPLAWPAAIAVGAALALSSTAFAIQIMRDRGELTTPHGDRAFAILLFQDLAIVPLLALVAFLAPGGGVGGGWEQVAIALGAVALVVVFGRYGLTPLFRVIALARSDEIFTASALLVVIAAALLMQLAGLSMAMGAFLAGVLLAESEFRHQLEADIEPFRGLFLGLFFMSVGMSVAWPVVVEFWWVVLLGTVVLYLGKAVFLFVLTRGAGSSIPDAIRIAALLGQGGEFGFVILGLGTSMALWQSDVSTVIAAVIVLTMVLTPFAVSAADRAVAPKGGADMEGIEEASAVETPAPVIVAGFGRFGQVVARILKLRGYEVTLIDNDPERIRIAETFGNKVFFGDLRRSDVLKLAAAGEAKAIFLCGDDVEAIAKALLKLRARLPQTPIYCRAADRFEQNRLEKLGATGVVRETFESSIALARDAIGALDGAEVAQEIVEEFRRRDEQLLKLQAEYGAKGGYEKMREQFSLDEER